MCADSERRQGIPAVDRSALALSSLPLSPLRSPVNVRETLDTRGQPRRFGDPRPGMVTRHGRSVATAETIQIWKPKIQEKRHQSYQCGLRRVGLRVFLCVRVQEGAKKSESPGKVAAAVLVGSRAQVWRNPVLSSANNPGQCHEELRVKSAITREHQ